MKQHMRTDRRNFVIQGMTAAIALVTRDAIAEDTGSALSLANRTHIFARPDTKDKLVWCFSTILGCGQPQALALPALAQPILAFSFPGGGSLSVEFTEEALEEKEARRGCWLELRTDDAVGLQSKVLAAGFLQVRYPATSRFYFMAPGGQVFGIVPAQPQLKK